MYSQRSITADKAATTTQAGDLPDALKHFDLLPDSALIGTGVICALVGNINDVTLWRWVRDGLFPAPFKLPGSRINSWRVGAIRKYLAAQEADHAAS